MADANAHTIDDKDLPAPKPATKGKTKAKPAGKAVSPGGAASSGVRKLDRGRLINR